MASSSDSLVRMEVLMVLRLMDKLRSLHPHLQHPVQAHITHHMLLLSRNNLRRADHMLIRICLMVLLALNPACNRVVLLVSLMVPLSHHHSQAVRIHNLTLNRACNKCSSNEPRKVR